MIGKPEWFTRRKYGGWGLTPATWQGWVYVIAMILPLMIFSALPYWTTEVRLAVTGVWVLVLAVDVIDIMMRLRMDEREKLHEAIAERNAAWYMVIVLAAGLVYGMVVNALQERVYVDPFIAIALFGAVLVKAATNIYLDKKN
jgi:divalent metal cation (Fe/Co/Zn/Cd) transporter